MTIRVKQCCCGCGLDIGTRLLIWSDLLATSVVALNIITNIAFGRINESYWCPLMFSAFIVAIKLVIGIVAVLGLKNKKMSYLRPYIVCNVTILMITALLVLVAIFNFDKVADITYRWYDVKEKYNIEEDSSDATKNQIPDDVKALWMGSLWITIVCVFFNILIWTYFIIVIYSYYETLREGGNFTNISGVEYFTPTEQMASKNTPQYTHPPSNRPPPYFTTEMYPTQPIVFLQAPPSYDEITVPKVSLDTAAPSTKQ